MKSNFFKILSCALFSMFLLNAGQAYGQADISKESKKSMPGESAKPNPLKGEYSNNGECVDLYVKKGCVNYSVCVAGDKTCDKAPVIKVCADAKSATAKPTNICKKGAKRITVKYERLDPNADVEFKTRKADTK